VPGAALAVRRGDELLEAAAGVASLRTRVPATPETVFQIGSITKVYTTTLLMQAVDDGRIELDAPIRAYLPHLELADREAAATITVRHLLTHTSGIDGDFFQDTGRGDDCLERYVLACATLPQVHPPGAMFSYCNAGFVIAGRLVEVLRGTTWDRALRERLLDPIGAEATGSLPEEALLHSAAIGHLPDASGAWSVAPVWYLMRSNAPAGATPFATARDLAAFGQVHARGGVAADGTRVLSLDSARAMQTSQVVPPGGQGFGLGLMLEDWGGRRVIGHTGGTLGQASFLRVLPDENLAVALLTNGGNSPALYVKLFAEIFGELAGIGPPRDPQPDPSVRIEPARFVGRFERLSLRVDVAERHGELVVTALGLRGLREPPAPPQRSHLRPITETRFAIDPPGPHLVGFASFEDFDASGRARYFYSSRVAPRVSGPGGSRAG
jgi:CubicO group peptidase (beta-lactamase class C family)